MSSDADWKNWGKHDPYFGVISHDHFHRDSFDDRARENFFSTGEEHVNYVLKVLKRLWPDFAPKLIIDYGCGTGRLAIPFSKCSAKVIGLDISEGMLAEALKNTQTSGINNVEYRLVTDDGLSVLPETVDMIHSFIVFQHIPHLRGEEIFRSLLNRLSPGGYGAVQFTFDSKKTVLKKSIRLVRNAFPALNLFLNLVKKKSKRTFPMRMESYRLSKLIEIMHENDVNAYYCERTEHDGYLGLFIFFRKDEKPGVVPG
jgi:ubiquinone/menaquinone biosynthesis C-methylase UbiE